MFSRLVSLVRSRRLSLTLTIILGWIGGLCAIVQAWMLSLVIDSVFLGGQNLQAVFPWMFVIIGAVGLRAVAMGGLEISANAVAVRVKTDLRKRLMNHIIVLGPAYTTGERTGELVAAAVDGIEALDDYFSKYLPQVALAAFIPLSILLLVFPIDPLTGIVFLLTAPLIPLFMYLIGKAAETLTKRQYETLGRLSAYLLDALQGLTTLKLLGHSKEHAHRIDQVSDRFRDVTLSVLRVTFLSALALELIATLSTAIVAVEIGLRLLAGSMDFQQALFILILAPDFYQPLRTLGLRFHAGISGMTAARHIFEILDTPARTILRSMKRDLPAVFEITFDRVSYAYPSRRLSALAGVSFVIQQGKLTALVGPSGAGKSTVAELLLRFIEPDQGEIRVNGIPLECFNLHKWRSAVAWVPQSPYLFNGTIETNVRLARSTASSDEVMRAIELAGLGEFAASLPHGMETPIGERGARLSAGQAQRLALARAFLHDAPFLILDEPTSNLDPASEANLNQAVRNLMEGRTALVIAHRINTTRTADRIICLENGRVVESGLHDDLVQHTGSYTRLINPKFKAGEP